MIDLSAMKAGRLFDLAGEVAIVTGASSGFGRRFACVLAANGAKVALVARRIDRLETLAADIACAGGEATAIQADVTDASQMRSAFDTAEARLGVVTICVNNAGVARSGRLIDSDDDGWRESMTVNLDAVRSIGVMAAQRMAKARKHGAIVNVASIAAFGVGRGVAAYSVSKAAVVQLTRSMGLEFAKIGVRANALAPGYFVTELNADWLTGDGAAMANSVPMRRFGQEGELDGALLLLAAPRAGAYITGATYVVDGGHLLPLAGA